MNDRQIGPLSLYFAGGRSFNLTTGTTLTAADLPGLHSIPPGGPVARVTSHPTDPTIQGLQNLSQLSWRVQLPNGDSVEVKPGKNVRLAAKTRINFGSIEAEIDTPLDANASSANGNFVDVATHGSSKTISLGVVWLLMGSGAAILVVIALSAIKWEYSRGINEITGIMIPMAAISALVAWLLVATAVRRFRAALDPDCYLRAGPDGLSFRIPGTVILSSLLFGYRINERHLSWDEVKTWYPYLRTINGIPSESAIVVETVRGGRITISTMYFSESRRQIANNIILAASG